MGVKDVFSVFFMVVPMLLWGQNSFDGSATRAIVIGVSEYQDEGILDLKYAHRDAKAFEAFIRNRMDNPYIQTFINQEATLASLQTGLLQLLNGCEKGDRAIIYFAGHGDVETKNAAEKGYLLAYDTPKNNYRLNALDIAYLSDTILYGLFLKGVATIVILDACHSGNLAGHAIGGREATATELAKRAGNEIKILSCQPYELSYESEEMGQGRGIFSYFLTDGLYGRADMDNDRQIDLFELEDFVKKNVRFTTQKQQHPEIAGGRLQEVLFDVSDSIRTSLRSVEKQEIERNFETETLQKLASKNGFFNYKLFKQYLEKGPLISSQGKSAFSFYELLYADTSFIPLRGIINDRMTNAFLDSAQQAINAYLKTDPVEISYRDKFDRRYLRFADYLRRSADILGARDSRYRSIQAKQYYFEGLARRLEAEQYGDDRVLFELALKKQRQALLLETRAAYIYNEIGLILLALDSVPQAIAALIKAEEIAPTWAIPPLNLGVGYYQLDSLDKAEESYLGSLALKPDFSSTYCNLGNVYAHEAIGMLDSAEYMYRKAIALYPEDKDYFYDYGILLAYIEGREAEAEQLFLKALALDSTYEEVFYVLGELNKNSEKIQKAEYYYKKALSIDADYVDANQSLGVLYFEQNRPEDARRYFLRAIQVDSFFQKAWEGLAVLSRDSWKSSLIALVNQSPLDTSGRVSVCISAGMFCFEDGDLAHAALAFEVAIELNPDDPVGYFGICLVKANQRIPAETLYWLELTLLHASNTGELNDYIHAIDDYQQFDFIKKNKEFKAIIKKFPLQK